MNTPSNSKFNPIIFTLHDDSPIAEQILNQTCFEKGLLSFRHFPDGETYMRILSDVTNREIILVESLNQLDFKILPILLFFQTVKDLGAKSVGLIAPYLAYMRQDKRFNPGEGITARYFANILSTHVDWLMTMDPHLHRFQNLNEIYAIKTYTLQAAQSISDWITTHVSHPVLIGPDAESKQWVETIAKLNNLPFTILEKIRYSDTHVEISFPDKALLKSHTPVLMDDIISTGHTLLAAINVLNDTGLPPPVCIGVHAIFAGSAYETLSKIPDIQIVTCNTIKHSTNKIDVSGPFIQQLNNLGNLSNLSSTGANHAN